MRDEQDWRRTVNRMRYLAVGLLCLTGILHVTRLGMPESGAVFDTVVVAFGVTYLLIAGLLFRDSRTAYYLGAIVPLIGIGVGVAGGVLGMLSKPTAGMALLLAIDIAVVVSCLCLIRGKRGA